MRKHTSHLTSILTLFLFLALIISDSIPQETSDENRGLILMEVGEELYRQGEYEEALDRLKTALTLIKKEKNLSRLYFQLSLVYYALGDTQKPEEYLRKMFEIDPGKKIDERKYPWGYVEIFNRVFKEYLEAPPTPKVKVKETEAKPKKKKGGAFLYIIGGLAVAGGAAALLLAKKGGEAGQSNGGTPPSGPTTGSIQVNSSPTGAQVYLDGNNTGEMTNCTLSDVSPGSHTVKVVREGYVEQEESVSVIAGQTTTVNITLSKHTITVTRPKRTTIWKTGEIVKIKWNTSDSSVNLGDFLANKGFVPGSYGRLNFFTNLTKTNRMKQNSLTQGFAKLKREHKQTNESLRGVRFLSHSAGTQSILETVPLLKRRQNITHYKSALIRASQGMSILNRMKLSDSAGKSPQSLKPSRNIKILTITDVKIDLYKGKNYVMTIASSTANTGTYTWIVDTSLTAASNYKVRVSCSSEPDIYSESTNFKIQESATGNLAPNPSFENGTSFPNGWDQSIYNGTGNISWSTAHGHSGSYSIKVSNTSKENLNWACWFGVVTKEFINVDISSTYELSVWYMYTTIPTLSEKTGLTIYLLEYDANGNWLQAYGVRGRSTNAVKNTWYELTTSMYDPSRFHAQTAKVEIEVVYSCNQKTDNTVVYFDDVSLLKK